MSDASPLGRVMQQLSGPRRFIALGVVAAAVVVLWGVGRWASAPAYVTLFHDLDLKEAGTVGESLGKSDISYRLGGGGTEILVPASDLARARVALAREGLPTSGRPGLELFDKTSWGMTDFTQRVTYQRALEGELARTIGGIKGVQGAQVHLMMPTPNPVKRLESPASASVVLALKPGATLSPETIQGITYIVSNSVEQLSSDNVAVMDDGGHVLSIPAGSLAGAGMSIRQLEIERSVEQYLGDKVESMLATVVGMGRARAQVSAQLSFDQVERTNEDYNPDGAVLQTEQRSETGAGSAAESSGSQTIVSNAYQNSRKMERVVGSVGNVTKLTVAVLVDRDAVNALAGAGGTDAQLARLESMVRNAIGVDSTRGDRVSLMVVHFEPNPVAAAAAAGGGAAKGGGDVVLVVERVSRPLIGIIAIVALVIVALRALRSTGEPAARAAPPGPAEWNPVTAGPERGTINGRLRSELEDRSGDATAQVMRAWLSEN